MKALLWQVDGEMSREGYAMGCSSFGAFSGLLYDATMARFLLSGESLVVRLSVAEKLGAMRGDVVVPLVRVRSVRASESPWSELRGMRAPGTGIPGVISLCTRRGPGFRDFVAVYAGLSVVVVETEALFDRLVVSSRDAQGDVGRICSALPVRSS